MFFWSSVDWLIVEALKPTHGPVLYSTRTMSTEYVEKRQTKLNSFQGENTLKNDLKYAFSHHLPRLVRAHVSMP